MRRVLVALLLAALPGLAQAAQEPAGDAAAGHTLARQWCASCHAVDTASPTRATDVAPPGFTAIAAKPGVSAEGLRAAVQTRHGQMPNFRLDRIQVGDVVAYILSLRP